MRWPSSWRRRPAPRRASIASRRIHRRTEGNPLFLRELLRLPGTSARQPEGIREVVRARLSLLTPDVRLILEAAAVLGREFALEPLVEIVRAAEVETLAAECRSSM